MKRRDTFVRALSASVAVAAFLAGMGSAGGASPTAADPGWTVQKAAIPQTPNGQFTAVSCLGTAFCVAVGDYHAPTGQLDTLVESWNGSTWTKVNSPNPGGNTGSSLASVSCTTASACTAVGSYDTAHLQTLVETWNGTVWTTVPSASPGGSLGSVLAGVSCTSTACTAVGNYQTVSGRFTLVETLNGTAWTQVPSPSPSGTNAILSGVSCTTGTACTAVGSYGTVYLNTLVETWNGTEWAQVSSPSPGGSHGSSLSGVSCAAANACTAVGTYGTPYEHDTLVETWNGATWAQATSPSPGGRSSSRLASVACTGPSACSAVGYYGTSAGSDTFVVTWSGAAWTQVVSPSPGTYGNQLLAVSCQTATACSAVGDYYMSSGQQHTLNETWNGSVWTQATSPSPEGSDRSKLTGVSCLTPTACVAVGTYITPGGWIATSAETWNGVRWTRTITRNPGGHNGTYLAGVSCTAANTCTAVGTYRTPSLQRKTLVETWNGVSWSKVSSPNPGSTIGSALAAVSCTSATACVAVGNYVASTQYNTLVLSWNGTTWTKMSSPSPADPNTSGSYLTGVSCASATACTAVGYYFSSTGQHTLIETWNGTTWTQAASPSPGTDYLAAVSCASPTACTAVGNSSTPSRTGLLIETWDGTAWTQTNTADPSENLGSALFGVSCTAATACTAVGNYGNPADRQNDTLIETWNGTTWTQAASPNPGGTTGSYLAAVSCSTSTSCTTVGNTPEVAFVEAK